MCSSIADAPGVTKSCDPGRITATFGCAAAAVGPRAKYSFRSVVETESSCK